MRIQLKLSVFVALLVLNGCGFHLRGSNYDASSQINRVLLIARGAPTLDAELKRQFRYNDITVTSKHDEAQAVVTVTGERSDERVLSVDPRTGKAREYELGYHVTFKIDDPQGRVLANSQNIDLSRDFTFDEAAALSKFEEAKVVRGEMQRDAVDSILRRLESIHPQTKK